MLVSYKFILHTIIFDSDHPSPPNLQYLILQHFHDFDDFSSITLYYLGIYVYILLQ